MAEVGAQPFNHAPELPVTPCRGDEPGQGSWELAARVSCDCWRLGFGYWAERQNLAHPGRPRPAQAHGPARCARARVWILMSHYNFSYVSISQLTI